MKKLLFILVAMCMALTVSAGDGNQRLSTIHFKSGEVVTGIITSRNDATVDITVDEVKYTYMMDEIAYISHETKKKNYDKSRFRGFIDLGYAWGFGEPRNNYWLIETSFGYMLTQQFYLGGGIALHNFSPKVESYPMRLDTAEPTQCDPDGRSPCVPLYAEGRYSLHSENGHTPWASLKLGANVINHFGFFASPSVGWHFATNQYFTINVGIGYALHTAHYHLPCLGDSPGAINDGIGGAYINKGAAFHNVFVKLGVEF